MRYLKRQWRTIAFVALIVVAVGSAAWNIGTRINTQTKTTSSLDASAGAIEKNCTKNEALFHQYKVRGEDLIVVARAVKLTSSAFVEAVKQSPPPRTARERMIRRNFVARYEAVVPRLQHVLTTIHILPLPDCKAVGEELRSQLPPG